MTGISFWNDAILRRTLGNNKSGCCQPRLSLFFSPSLLDVQTRRVLSTLPREEHPQELLGSGL